MSLLATAVLGTAFLAIKGYEYLEEAQEHVAPVLGLSFHWQGAHELAARHFFQLYFAMTGLHALHLFQRRRGGARDRCQLEMGEPPRTGGRILLALHRHCLGDPVSPFVLSEPGMTLSRLILAYIGLLVMLALTVASSYVDLAGFKC
ncbi:hypothetical protein [Mesorhizobium australicum]|uniref:hypothetical protein n=1 Tax=Mesorhizobium australicum TaxID=536018 RepID=UPI00333A0ED7